MSGNWLFEGININLSNATDRANTTIQFQNIRHDILRHIDPPAPIGHYGGDSMQIFKTAGPKTLNIDRYTVGVSDYQCFWWESDDTSQVRNVNNVNINGNGTGGANPPTVSPTTSTDLFSGHWVLVNENSATVNCSNVYLYAPIKGIGPTVNDQPGNKFTPLVGNTLTYSQTVKHADFVSTAQCGLNYTSPGYV